LGENGQSNDWWCDKTSIVTAFTIAAALIWKDVLTEAINRFAPSGDLLLYKFLTAIIVTIIVVIAVYIILRTQSEAEIFLGKLKKKDLERIQKHAGKKVK
jgi:hypothetical protein